ncbi:Hypothetical protein CpPa08_1448 [Corynebacterium pseudotuberculosis]|nr:Hypothetical protein Cp3995_1502 [Corynebacterium pseudotuberculosis 3/99-5]AFF22613.1 Hypothetical protein CpP54B96_1485 [Corynebacterium pseudotuberculosis P54B96]AIG07882.1 hypothetical protein CPTA_02053 [Corynebacterium pseudotuberculosis]AIG09764.1 hypothetical protein CPTB_01708 [Corynebacterium pseudotuberculosis]AIG12338.1 hypothetical protein CPTC_02050 [Corynebacterium pseudotuberculosis]
MVDGDRYRVLCPGNRYVECASALLFKLYTFEAEVLDWSRRQDDHSLVGTPF